MSALLQVDRTESKDRVYVNLNERFNWSPHKATANRVLKRLEPVVSPYHAIIAGGFLRDAYLRLPVTDIDVFILGVKNDQQVRQELGTRIRRVLEGDSLANRLAYTYNPGNTSTQYISTTGTFILGTFSLNWLEENKVLQTAYRDFWRIPESIKVRKLATGNNALVPDIQIIGSPLENSEALLAQFDYTINQFAYSLGEDMLCPLRSVTTPLVPVRWTDPMRLLRRGFYLEKITKSQMTPDLVIRLAGLLALNGNDA
jgi:hypothetical protein